MCGGEIVMAKARASGEGTVYKNEKRDRWEGQFSYTDPETGEKKRKKVTGTTQKEVAAKGKAFLDALKEGMLPNAGKITVWEWVERWLEDYAKVSVRIKTYEKYEQCMKGYIKNTIGHVQMQQLTAPDVQRVFNTMLKTGGRSGKGVSACTVRNTRQVFSMALNKAVQVGIVFRNVVRGTEPPRMAKEEIQPLDVVQVKKLLKVAGDGEYIYYGVKQRQKPSDDTKYLLPMAEMVLRVALGTGMRQGEVFGLKWSDIDFKKNTINVQRSLVSSRTKGMIFQEPKTKTSIRKIAIQKKLSKALEKYKKEQEWFATFLGDKFDNKDGLVFTNSFGCPVDAHNFTNRYFKRMLKQAGVADNFTFHDLRHTHATLLLKKGVNIKVISERLGHSKIQLTLDGI